MSQKKKENYDSLGVAGGRCEGVQTNDSSVIGQSSELLNSRTSIGVYGAREHNLKNIDAMFQSRSA